MTPSSSLVRVAGPSAAWRSVLRWPSLSLLCWSSLLACATYEETPGSATSSGGDAGDSGSGGGQTTGGTSTAGKAGSSSAGKTNGGTSGKASGGSAGEDAGGSGGAAQGGNGGAAGKAGSGGKAGAGGSGGSAGNAGQGGASGSAGSGGAPACTTDSPDASCSCVVYDAHDFWFCTANLGFLAAEAKCTAVGMHLPKVESMPEDAWLFSACTTRSMGEYYLGSSDANTQNSWSWLAGGKFWDGVANGTASGYENWNTGEPNASGDCLVVQNNNVWDDRSCDDQRKYICEAPP